MPPKVTFYRVHLFERVRTSGSQYVALEENTFPNGEFPFDFKHGDDMYCEGNIEKAPEYIWIAGKYGKTEPRNDSLINITTGEKKKNQRNSDEAELVHQFFCLFHFSKQFAFIYPREKASLVKSTLQLRFDNREFRVKNIYKSIEEMVEELHAVNEISFTHVDDLFNEKEKTALVDLTGTDSPAKFTIKAQYGGKLIHEIKKFILQKGEKYSKSMVVKGTDEKGLPHVFNADTFQSKHEITCEKDHNGQIKIDSIKENLILKVRETDD